MTVWDEPTRKAKIDILSRQEKDTNQDQDLIHFPHGSLPFDFIPTTTCSRQRDGDISEVRDTWLLEKLSHGKLTPFQRRRKQNRDSQRAFRARERTRVQGLVDRLADLTQQHRELELAYVHLNTKYRSLVENVEIKEEEVEANASLWQERFDPVE
jgi:hypothetical protein